MSIALNASHARNAPSRTTGATTPAESAGCVHSAQLLRGQKAVEIVHNGSTYRLQATRLGKLILTK